MELLNAIPLVGPVLGAVIPFIFVLSVVVFVHEMGHYLVGRWCGIHAEVFSIGFGKEIYGWEDRRGTRWRVAVLPLGGYVKFLGDADAASANSDAEAVAAMRPEDRERSFPGAKLWKRAATVAAGPMANFLLTAVMVATTALIVGMPDERPVIGVVAEDADLPLREGDLVRSVDGQPVDDFSALVKAASAAGAPSHTVVVEREGEVLSFEIPPLIGPEVRRVDPRGAAGEAGMLPGDRMTAVDGDPIHAFEDLRERVFAAEGETLEVTVERADGTHTLMLTPRMTPFPLADGGVEMRPMIGVSGQLVIGSATRPAGIGEAAVAGVEGVGRIIQNTFSYLDKIIGGEADASGLGGPLRIASMSGEAATAGFGAILGMIAMISTSIGLMNLLPIPVLDGGHLVFYAIEAVRGKPLPDRAAEAATGFGLALVLALMAFVTWNDIAWL
ncbi:RIP metalloprotease RseP [Rhodovulum sp. DZ06]|uniref:RIP metalloprotease RseP n=1 Tax=Rhodovulum sp. DZ06 TaxID=3425126 RepID=UPI003D32D974